MHPVPAGYERRKHPQKVRSDLLDATAAIIAEQGLARVTVEAVAKSAGVTKGGLFHHFPSKQALIDGVLDMIIADAEDTIATLMAADPEPHGRFTRAMLAAASGDRRVGGAVSTRLLCIAMVCDPLLQRRWADWIAVQLARHAAMDDNVSCAIVRLAADGIWLSSLHEESAPPPLDPAIYEALVAMTRPPAEHAP